jgi:peroxiredoxin
VYGLQQRIRTENMGGGSLREAPAFRATDLTGRLIDSKDIVGQKTALLFVSTKCRSCNVTLRDLEVVSAKAHGNVIVVCQDKRAACEEAARQYGLSLPIIIDQGDDLGERFGVTSVPTAVLINEEYQIQSYGSPMEAEEVEEMLREASNAEAGAAA